MNTVILVLMLLTAFNLLLKQTFWKVIAVCVIAAICAAFAGLMWPYAIEPVSYTHLIIYPGYVTAVLPAAGLLKLSLYTFVFTSDKMRPLSE